MGKLYVLKVWYCLVEWAYHRSMSFLKVVSSLRGRIFRLVSPIKEQASGCPGDCLNKLSRPHEPSEWVERNGNPYPIFRVASLRIPINRFHVYGAGGYPIHLFLQFFACLPKDAKIIDVRYGLDYGQVVEYLVESLEFPEVAESARYPRLDFIRKTKLASPEETEIYGCSIIEYYDGWRINPY